MIGQQQNVDTIANNLANVNTFGYKKERMEFKTLLYETIQRADLDPANQTGRPVNLQVGHGVRPVATARTFTDGNFERTDNKQDVAIEGDGFFVIQRAGQSYYTRDGAFKIAVTDNGSTLVTADGYPVLGTDNNSINIPADVSVNDVTIAEDGSLSYTDANGQYQDLGSTIQLVQFANPQGLEAIGSNLYKVTSASGDALAEAGGGTNTLSSVRQGILEMSNVEVAEEMVNLIVAQRAFDLNAKGITTADEMLATANGLKR
jgi:flagellar basal-body rod protein FlgG